MRVLSTNAYDVVIVGGGPTGAALAIALQGSGLTVLVLEARADAGKSNDARTLAMSYGSRLILERLAQMCRTNYNISLPKRSVKIKTIVTKR